MFPRSNLQVVDLIPYHKLENYDVQKLGNYIKFTTMLVVQNAACTVEDRLDTLPRAP